MRTIYLEYFLRKKIKELVISPADLMGKLVQLEESFDSPDGNLGVSLEDENQNFLSIGLLPNKWSLIWGDGPMNMLYSQGDLTLNGHHGIFWEEWSGVASKEFIEKKQAWEAVKYWLETGKPSPLVNWTDEVQ